jgi:hypothetical protein
MRARAIAPTTTLSVPAAAQDAQPRALLLSNARCSFSYDKVIGASRIGLDVTWNGNGSFVLSADGKECAQCR